tara:strand:+ start:804 stop:1184 length:381 start_codon:yes stop_codon:yes gene_type:complete
MNTKPISDFLFNISTVLRIDNNKYDLKLEKNTDLDSEIKDILNKEQDLELRKNSLAILYLKYLVNTDFYQNFKSCITDDIDEINENIKNNVITKLAECKYLNLLSRYVLKKHSISAKDLNNLLEKN